MELAIDTSSEIASVALAEGSSILAELTWSSRQRHTVDLIPGIDFIFRQAKADKKELTAVFVARGPGSFNGLRVGLSAAKSIAYTLQIPLVGIDTLEIAAFPFAFTGMMICSMHGAGRSEIAVAFYRQMPEGWKCLEEPHLTDAETLCGKITEPTVFCGEMPDNVINVLNLRLGQKAIIPSPEARMRRASFLIMPGLQKLKDGKMDSAETLQPLYLRPPPITMRKVK